MDWNFIDYGKVALPGLEDLEQHYIHFIKRFTADNSVQNISLTHLKSKKDRVQDAETLIEHISTQQKSKKLKTPYQLWVLEVTGTQGSTQEWSEWIQCAKGKGIRSVLCVVGGPDGMDLFTLKNSPVISPHLKLISLGLQTLPHDLAKIVFLEQTARGLSLIHNHPYHRQS